MEVSKALGNKKGRPQCLIRFLPRQKKIFSILACTQGAQIVDRVRNTVILHISFSLFHSTK